MANCGGNGYLYLVLVSLCALALFAEQATANDQDQHSKRIYKRSAFDDWKRGGQQGYLNELESALGTMQRPRFGKRARFDPSEDYVLYTDKRGNSMVDLGAALGTIQRPRFGRRR